MTPSSPAESSFVHLNSKALFLLEETEIEKRLNMIRIGISSISLLVFSVIQLVSRRFNPAAIITLVTFTLWLGYGVTMLRVHRIKAYHRGYRFVTIIVDLLVVTVVNLALAYQYGRLDDWLWPNLLVAYFFLVSISALRQSRLSSFISGLCAVVLMEGTNYIVPRLGGTSQDIFAQLMYLVAFSGMAYVSYLIIRRQRILLLRLADEERKQALNVYAKRVRMLEREVSQQTADLKSAKENAEQRAAELEAIRQATLSLTSSLSLEVVLNSILESTLRLFPGAQNAHIFLAHPGEEDLLTFGAALWADGRSGEALATPRSDGLTATVALKGEMIIVEDMRNHPIYGNVAKEKGWTGSIVGLPLTIDPSVVGVMNISFSQPRKYVLGEQRVMQLLGDQAAIAIQNAHLHELSQQQAYTDALTNLPNRRSLDERLEVEIRRAARYDRIFAVVMIDLDGFKAINDGYGHLFGDHVLQKAANCMAGVVRDTDFLARFGGDEFALLMPETDSASATQICDRLMEASCMNLESPDGEMINIPISLGQALYPSDGATAVELIKKADEKLYLHKSR